ncbi:hypothetical protein M409DRAFT_63305 [Zasmidium cellare ATCC 36951]|uniref:GED domain-containing protein n=1 Tax=Zasmidium cellare ATCC 36951 TaxID=1080233 RepID=A0A6A6CZR1_ZASCE|nr:uncharacterized protein M409DRAFT_63305 [Zasmidium cellare ATCC 36951]KAF2171690.1 hypothetical protein M409DRAFT_63305 [Zasmidium cellare ATCC 36951]
MPTDALEQLQSPAQIELLDAVDRLRLEGCGDGELDLPQLIVCGDQSSGKSSVLEAISRVSFPASDTFCTRFASELILRKASTTDFSITLIPASDRPEDEKRYISSYTAPAELMAIEDFPKVVKLAGEHIDRLRRHERSRSAFLTDKLVARIRGPHLPPLTLVDLPGLIHTSGDTQTSQDIAVVRKILNDYMSDKSSIILAVLAADNNKANQEVLQLAKNHDQIGERTLGIITKPDKVDAGSNNEIEWIKRTQGNASSPRLGWHVLKNRSFEHRDATSDQRDAHETKFFESCNWSAVPKDCRGIASLRTRLSVVLLRKIRECLPGISRGIDDGIRSGKMVLEKLGQPRTTTSEQQKYLTEISFKLMELVKGSLQGHYGGTFYAGDDADAIASRKIRSRLQDTLDNFMTCMGARGHLFLIREDKAVGQKSKDSAPIDLSVTANLGAGETEPIEVSRSGFLRSTTTYMKQNRGCDLPGVLSSEVVTHLFHLQSCPWEALSNECVDRCWTQVGDFFRQALEHVASLHTANAIMNEFAADRLESIRDDLFKKLGELLKPYRKGHLITLNRAQLLDICQRKSLESEPRDDKKDSSAWSRDESSNDFAAASQALNCMQAYYHIAGLTFMETVATLAIENCLVDGLLDLFTPMTVPDLGIEVLQALTAEPTSVAIERRRNQEKLKVLRDVSCIIRKHSGRDVSTDFQSAHSPESVPSRQKSQADGQERANTVHVDIKCESTPEPKPFAFASTVITPPPTPPNEPAKDGWRRRSSRKSPSPLSRGSSKSSAAAGK